MSNSRSWQTFYSMKTSTTLGVSNPRLPQSMGSTVRRKTFSGRQEQNYRPVHYWRGCVVFEDCHKSRSKCAVCV